MFLSIMIYYFLQTGAQSFEGVQQNSVPTRKYAGLQNTLRYGRTTVTQTERLEILLAVVETALQLIFN